MLQATRAGAFSSSYDITLDGRPLTRWDKSMWRRGGSFTVEGRPYEVGGNFWGTSFTLTDQSGMPVASAGNPSRRQWTIATGGRTYEFRRRGWWRQHYDLLVDGQVAGYVARPSSWRRTAVAELPTLPLAAQVFVLAVALTAWDAAAASAAGAGGAAGG